MLRYWRESWKCRRRFGDSAPSWKQLLHWQRMWSDSLLPGRTSLQDEWPWITFGAQEFLKSRLTSTSQVFEWGSGGSSLFFSRRAARVVSVEHNADWFDRVRIEAQRQQLSNWEGFLELPQPGLSAPEHGLQHPDPADWEGYVSDGVEFRGCHFRNYAARIDAYPHGSFDVVLIDGRARPSCLKHALSKVRAGGCIVWDNSERQYYHPAMRHVPASYERLDFPGPGPYVSGFWRTTVWIHQGNAKVRATAA